MVWNVMGQIYIPKQVDQNRMWWEGIIPEETYIPPHSHSTQDEFLYLTEGELDMLLDGEEKHAVPGEIIPFPRYSNHGLFNNSGKTVKGNFFARSRLTSFSTYSRLYTTSQTLTKSFASPTRTISIFNYQAEKPGVMRRFESISDKTGLLYVILQGNENRLRDVEFAPKLGEELREQFGDAVVHKLEDIGYSFTAGINT